MLAAIDEMVRSRGLILIAGSFNLADARATLAAPLGGRIFFAGEACSPHDFTTAHGAYQTGIEAADEAIRLRPRGI
jgi:hypothetical protein